MKQKSQGGDEGWKKPRGKGGLGGGRDDWISVMIIGGNAVGVHMSDGSICQAGVRMHTNFGSERVRGTWAEGGGRGKNRWSKKLR